MASRRIPIALLAGVLITAHFALNVQPERNGSWDLIKIFTWSQTHLGGTSIPLQIPRTGFPMLDSYVSFMVGFFAEALNPNNFRAHIHLHKLLGTLGSGFLLMLVEAHRGVGSSTFRIVTYGIELAGELLGVGLFTPIWCIIHLSLTNPPSVGNAKAVDGHWSSLGYAFFLGHIIPTATQILTKPDAAGFSSQQLWTILRLFHPLFVLGLWNIFKARGSGTPKADREGSLEQQRSSIRKFYLFTILYSATFHISTFALLFSLSWIPAWLRADVSTAIQAGTVLVPVPFWTVQTGLSFADAVSIFLQWDDVLAAAALTIWSASLYVEALQQGGGLNSMSLSVAAQFLLIYVVGGSVAASAFLLQERDSIVFGSVSVKAKEH